MSIVLTSKLIAAVNLYMGAKVWTKEDENGYLTEETIGFTDRSSVGQAGDGVATLVVRNGDAAGDPSSGYTLKEFDYRGVVERIDCPERHDRSLTCTEPITRTVTTVDPTKAALVFGALFGANALPEPLRRDFGARSQEAGLRTIAALAREADTRRMNLNQLVGIAGSYIF